MISAILNNASNSGKNISVKSYENVTNVAIKRTTKYSLLMMMAGSCISQQSRRDAYVIEGEGSDVIIMPNYATIFSFTAIEVAPSLSLCLSTVLIKFKKSDIPLL